MNPKVSIIMGSTSDLPIMEQAAKLLLERVIPPSEAIPDANRNRPAAPAGAKSG